MPFHRNIHVLHVCNVKHSSQTYVNFIVKNVKSLYVQHVPFLKNIDLLDLSRFWNTKKARKNAHQQNEQELESFIIFI